MKQLYLYKVVKNNLEFPQLFEEIHFPQTGETVSVNSLFENNKKFLLKICKNEKKNALIKSQKMIKFAKDHKMIERVDENYIPAWFTDLKSIQYWQSQLRGNSKRTQKLQKIVPKKHICVNCGILTNGLHPPTLKTMKEDSKYHYSIEPIKTHLYKKQNIKNFKT